MCLSWPIGFVFAEDHEMFDCSPFFLQVAGGDNPSQFGRGVSEPTNKMLYRIVVSGHVMCICVWG